MNPIDLEFVDQAVARLGGEPECAIPLLQAVQEHYHYLPTEALERICRLTRITPSQLEGVASFYGQFRRQPRGERLVRVCHGTACHVRGAELVDEAIRRQLNIPAKHDTDAAGRYTIEPVACLGCCTLAPVVQVQGRTYGPVDPVSAAHVIHRYEQELAGAGGINGHDLAMGELALEPAAKLELRVGLGSCCMVKGSDQVLGILQQAARHTGGRATVKRVGCVGMCHQTPMVEVWENGRLGHRYVQVTLDQVKGIVRDHLDTGGWAQRTGRWLSRTADRLLTSGATTPSTAGLLDDRDPRAVNFLGPQVRIATEHFGCLDPLSLPEYRAHHGFAALQRCLTEKTLDYWINQIVASGLRGRGGAGFPTGKKWELARAAPGPVKYVICNGDEGDPGAFMDRMILESFPYRVIEGLTIAAYVVGATQGYLYIRAEYPLAVKRVRAAILQCREHGWLGQGIAGTNWSFDLEVKEGAGAFVCGEETALIQSLEGQRGTPRLRPPYPVEKGLWDKPTLVNNVETLAMVPWILRHGPQAFSALGTEGSRGTKVFALAGKVRRGGLIEVPMGMTIRQIVQDIGGGVEPGRIFKAVQIGGPSGGCIPAALADTPIDYQALSALGAIMGSGGLVVMDDTDCMVDIARYFLAFTQDQSCGQCTYCRVGTRRMLDILDRLCTGKGRPDDLRNLESLSHMVQQGSLCGLGRTAPNPVLTTLRYFREEYEAHLAGRCPAHRCKDLISYRITDACIGCTICAQQCPVHAIPYAPYQKHVIDSSLCTRCDICRQVCPVPQPSGGLTGGAVLVE